MRAIHPSRRRWRQGILGVAFACGVGLALPGGASAQQRPVKPHQIAGAVTSASGPEAGVWVIAETTDLPTRYARIVVTDDKGRYLIPDLPQANYALWVRGYGLVDSAKVRSAPGKTVSLSARVAPNAKAAAQYYPALY